MNSGEAIPYIYSLRGRGKKAGLEKITRLLHLLGDPQERLPFVHIAGTNGKGSTAAMTAAVLQQAGYRTGRFISPFVIDFQERMQVDGQSISEEELVSCLEQVKPLVEQMSKEGQCPSEFEVVTALAMVFFARRACQVVVLEVGLGGRLDATNVIRRSLVSVLCSIGLDHVEILGDTIEKIAAEKCGILRPGSTTVCYPDQSPEALGVILEFCSRMGNRLCMGNKQAVTIQSMGLCGTDICYDGLSIHIPLIGRHQVYNCINVVETVKVLRTEGFAISDDALIRGIGGVSFPARMEILSQNPLIVLDGAHNKSGAKALEEALSLLEGRSITAIIGMLGDKDTAGFLSCIAPCCRRIFTVTPRENHRALTAQELARQAMDYCGDVRPSLDLTSAFCAAYEGLLPQEALLICGSLYLAADMRVIVQKFLQKP